MFFTVLTACIVAAAALAQPNNPYNQVGKDFIKSAQIVAGEIKNGTIKTADDETIGKVQSYIPSKTQMNPSLAGQIVKMVSHNPIPLSDALKSSSLKPEVQREISLMLEHAFTADNSKHKEWLKEKTESVLASSFDQRDKELLLNLIAIQYNQGNFEDLGRISCNTNVNGRVVETGEGMDCAGAAMLVGFTVGYTFCGIYCGIGGALIGFVAVALGSLS